MVVQFFRKKPEPAPTSYPAAVGDDRRVYAIGDIHGRADLFTELLGCIINDDQGRPAARTELILLGDLIDRGPQSRAVVEQAMALADGHTRIRFLMGNHEDVFLRAARGDIAAARFFRRIGGRETLLSYGIAPTDLEDMSDAALSDWMLRMIPRAHVDFIDGFEDSVEIGDYLFVHAGIRPNVPLAEQDPEDLRWIRNEFLTSDIAFDKIIVHGHTITETVEERPNRIGIDTGAYASGRLTALGLEGTDRWFLATGD